MTKPKVMRPKKFPNDTIWIPQYADVECVPLKEKFRGKSVGVLKYRKRKCPKHYPISNLNFTVSVSRIFPGLVGWDYFDFDNWVCGNCGKKLKATWTAK